ncbi:hypothetical protein D1627_04660 [Pontibacter oryzae]|uniref:Uncharacterized protein n=1 Tax=Pontibacter oryzae TaxID=2304593 RepID=A0A399SLK8_9BACT|nr:hypothetical protein D1627_04660 [Pontibacter oryzae]
MQQSLKDFLPQCFFIAWQAPIIGNANRGLASNYTLTLKKGCAGSKYKTILTVGTIRSFSVT